MIHKYRVCSSLNSALSPEKQMFPQFSLLTLALALCCLLCSDDILVTSWLYLLYSFAPQFHLSDVNGKKMNKWFKSRRIFSRIQLRAKPYIPQMINMLKP